MNIIEKSKKVLLASSIAVVVSAGFGMSAQNVLAAEANNQETADVEKSANTAEVENVEVKDEATKKTLTTKAENKAPVKIKGKEIGNHKAMIGDWTEVKVMFKDYYEDPDGDNLKFTVSIDKNGKEENVNIYEDHLKLYSNNTGKTTVTIKVEDGKGGVLTDSFVYTVIEDPDAPDIDGPIGGGSGQTPDGNGSNNGGSGNTGNNGSSGSNGSGNTSGNGGTSGGTNSGTGTPDSNSGSTNSGGSTTESNPDDGKTDGTVDKENTSTSDKDSKTEDKKNDDGSKNAVVKETSSKDTLPQTGSESSGLTTAIGAALIAVASFLGLRRKR